MVCGIKREQQMGIFKTMVYGGIKNMNIDAKKVLKNQVRSKMNNRCAYRVSACYEFEEYKDTYENKIEK